MAEIKIEKKPPVWPWVLAAIVLAGLIILYFTYDGTDEDVTDTTTHTVVSPTDDVNRENDAVDAYVEFVNQEQGRMGEDHEYTQQGLQKLTAAVRSLADEKGHDIRADLDQAEQAANDITDDPAATNHAQHIRNAADALTRAMTNMQQALYPDLQQDAQQLRDATENIDPQQQTLEQKEAVKSFFNESAELIQQME